MSAKTIRKKVGRTAYEKYYLYTEICDIGGCRIWCRAINNMGYGLMMVNGKNILVHRIAWELFRGPIPKGICVLHKCDNPLCCNPEHLFLGSQKENLQDMVKKGRSCSGEKNGRAKISAEIVSKIRSLYIRREVGKAHCGGRKKGALPGSQSDLAIRFGLTRSHIQKIVSKKRWK